MPQSRPEPADVVDVSLPVFDAGDDPLDVDSLDFDSLDFDSLDVADSLDVDSFDVDGVSSFFRPVADLPRLSVL